MLAFVGIPVYLFVMCICTGEVFLKLFGKGEGKNAGKNIIAGYVICAGLFHIISTPFMYYELSFSPLVYMKATFGRRTSYCCLHYFENKRRENII